MVKRASRAAKADKLPSPRGKPKAELSSVELVDDDMIEVGDTPMPDAKLGPGPGTRVRNAVKMPSGPLDQHLAQKLSQQPNVQVGRPVDPRSAIAAALPTAAAQPLPPHLQATIAPHLAAIPSLQPQTAGPTSKTIALSQGQPAEANAAWVKPTTSGNQGGQTSPRAAADEPTRQPSELDPRIVHTPMSDSASTGVSKPLKTGVRRGRSKTAVMLWIFIGAAVIGGGVFAGFQIRSMRLGKQIATARTQAVDLAKADTWQGWAGARDRLAGIARASGTSDNRAALARARGVLAYEFGDGLAEATAAVEKLGGDAGLDGVLAQAYVALARNDPKAARTAAEGALKLASDDAAALYVSGSAALLDGNTRGAIADLKNAHQREARPLYAVGLARAIGETGAWDDALSAIDRAIGAIPDHPAAQLERALLLAAAGRLTPANPLTAETRGTLMKLVAEGKKPLAEQSRGVAPAQVALAHIALARIDFALGDANAAMLAIRTAAEVGVDDRRFAEETLDALYQFGELARAKEVAATVLKQWPNSRRARITLGQVLIASGRPSEALEIFASTPDLTGLPRGLAVRGWAKLASDDREGARSDFDEALRKVELLDLALTGRAWIDLADGDLDAARKRIERRHNANQLNLPVTAVYAAILRTAGDPASLAQAKQLLDTAIAGPRYAELGRVYLELGRVNRDLSNARAARAAFGEAMRLTNSLEAKLEGALLLIEDGDPVGGRDTLDEVLAKEPNAMANASLVLEAARARMLAGDNQGAGQLLDAAEKLPRVERWKLERERGRLRLRVGDITGAAAVLTKALEGSGKDPETFLVAGDLITIDPKQTTALAQQVKGLVDARLGTSPEASVAKGKLALAAENIEEAEAAYTAAASALTNALPRRLAQAHFGLAIIAYNKGNDPVAQSKLDYVTKADPSIFTAYLYAAELQKAKSLTTLTLAKKSVELNPDFVTGWYTVGQLAAKLGRGKELDESIKRLAALAPLGPELKELQGLR